MSAKYIWLLVLSLAVCPGLQAQPASGFTYQGRLLEGGLPANGEYELRFALSSTLAGEERLSPVLTNAPVLVNDGLFIVSLDFGSDAFDGSARWLEIGVRTNGSVDDFTVLSPRQPITAVPYALHAGVAGATGSGSGTNVTVYGGLSLDGATNVVLYATNCYVVTTAPDTSMVVVSGAGTTAANGTYTLISSSPNLTYTNAGGMKLTYPADQYYWQLTDSADMLLYGSGEEDITNQREWETVSGTPPPPSAVAYGVSRTTNYITQLAIQGASTPAPALGNELYVDAANGNDLFALRGRPDLPYKTLDAALQAATNNDIVHVGPGLYSESFYRTLPPGLKLLGAGKHLTRLYGQAVGFCNLDLSSGNLLSGFSTDFVISLGGYGFTAPAYGCATNVVLENLEAFGVSDVVFCTWWQSCRAVNCDFYSVADCFADGQRADEGTNAVAELYNCRMVSGDHGVALLGRGQIRMYGGSIETTNARVSGCAWAWDTGDTGGSIELTGVALRHPPASASGRSYAVMNESSGHCTITVHGILLAPEDVYGAVNYVGLGLTTNLTVLGPGAITKTLCFTNGILMDVK
jgi:hypothetical protein